MAANQYNKECAERVFQQIGGTSWSSLEALRSCAGSTEEDRENELLEEELRSQHGDGQAVGEVSFRLIDALRENITVTSVQHNKAGSL